LSLPTFKYHPDPIKTGSIEPSPVECACCGEARGYIYSGPVYAEDELDDRICPWCISDGSAHAKFGASFTDEAGVGGYPGGSAQWDKVTRAVIEETAFRTPGFSGWQQEQWWTHCGDGAEFLGRIGFGEASKHGPDLLEALAPAAGFATAAERESYLRALDRDGSPTGYAFRCRHCGKLGGYSDSD
jgi:uncharacterized protein